MALLFIVARHRPDFFTSLKLQFSREEAAGKVQVLLDRRQGNQGERGQPPLSRTGVAISSTKNCVLSGARSFASRCG